MLVYITWFLALCSTFLSFCFDKKKVILSIQATTLLLFSSHLFLIWWFGGAWFLFLQIFRNIFFGFVVNKKYLQVWLVTLILIYTSVYFMSRSFDELAILPFVATILWTLWCYASNTTYVRGLFLSSTIPFTYYVFQSGSYFAIIIQLVFMISMLINILRFDILNKKIITK